MIDIGEGTGTGPLYELPPELALDTEKARQLIVQFIRDQLHAAGFERVVIGLSGGIDSTITAHLVAEAIGAEKLLVVMMPYKSSSFASRADAEEVIRRLGCASELVEITSMVDGYFGHGETPGAAGPDGLDAEPLRRGNFMSRQRMAVIYDRSVQWGGLVAGTGNRTESLIGYMTVYGDTACAFSPIGDLYKSQVRQLAEAVGVPHRIIRRRPTADLWYGQTDEGEGAFSYPELDRVLHMHVDQGLPEEEIIARGIPQETVSRYLRMYRASAFKRRLPPAPEVRASATKPA